MSEEQGHIRVVNVRGDEDSRPSKDETLIMMDRTNQVLGNKRYMRVKSRVERERVIEAYRKDLEADLSVGGPMHKTLLAIAKDIFSNGAKIGAG